MYAPSEQRGEEPSGSSDYTPRLFTRCRTGGDLHDRRQRPEHELSTGGRLTSSEQCTARASPELVAYDYAARGASAALVVVLERRDAPSELRPDDVVVRVAMH